MIDRWPLDCLQVVEWGRAAEPEFLQELSLEFDFFGSLGSCHDFRLAGRKRHGVLSLTTVTNGGAHPVDKPSGGQVFDCPAGVAAGAKFIRLAFIM